MTLRQFWELNISGNAAQVLQKLQGGADKLSIAFAKTDAKVAQLNGDLKGSNNTLASMRDRVSKLYLEREFAEGTKAVSRFNREIKATEKQIAALENRGKSTWQRFSENNPLASQFGKAAMITAGVGLAGAGLNNFMQTTMDYEFSKSKLSAISRTKGTELEGMTRSAREVAAGTKFSSTEAIGGMTYLSMAGMNAQQSKFVLPTASNLAIASDLGLDRTADILSNIMGQYELGATSAPRVANVVSATVSSSNTNFEQMSEAMKYLGPTANSLNMSLEETASIIGALGDAGIQGSMAGRALGTSMVNLAKPTKQQQQLIDELGIEFYNSNGQFVGMKGVLVELERVTKSMTDEQKAATISTLFQNESFQEMNILLNKGSENFDLYTQKITGTNEAMNMAATMQDNLKTDVLKLSSAWENLNIQISEGNGAIGNLFRTVTQSVTRGLDSTTFREKYGLSHFNSNPLFRVVGNEGQIGTDMEDIYNSYASSIFELKQKGGTPEQLRKEAFGIISSIERDYPDAAFKSKLDDKFNFVDGIFGNKEDVFAGFKQMKADLINSAHDIIKSVANDEAIKYKKGDGEAGAPSNLPSADNALAATATEINGGGGRVRNVITNIQNLVNEVQYVRQEANSGAMSEQEFVSKMTELLVRGIRGGEQALVVGE